MHWDLIVQTTTLRATQEWGALKLRAVKFLPGGQIYDWEWPDGPGPWFKGVWKWTWNPVSSLYEITLIGGNPGRAGFASLRASNWRFPIRGEEPMEPWFFKDANAELWGQFDGGVQGGVRFGWYWGDFPAADVLRSFLFLGVTYNYSPNNMALLSQRAKQEMFGLNAVKAIPAPPAGIASVPGSVGSGGSTVLVPKFARVTGLWFDTRTESVALRFAQRLANELIAGGIDAGRVVTTTLKREDLKVQVSADVVVDFRFPPVRHHLQLPKSSDQKPRASPDGLWGALRRIGEFVKSGGGVLPKEVQLDAKPAMEMFGAALQRKGLAGGDPPEKDYEDATRKHGSAALNSTDVIDDGDHPVWK